MTTQYLLGFTNERDFNRCIKEKYKKGRVYRFLIVFNFIIYKDHHGNATDVLFEQNLFILEKHPVLTNSNVTFMYTFSSCALMTLLEGAKIMFSIKLIVSPKLIFMTRTN